jgi:hypothetical protein
MNISQSLPALALLLLATTLEVSGDALVRVAIYNHVGVSRLGVMLAGAALLFGYGFSLNLAPVEFRQVVGLYAAILFVVWQSINFIVFRTPPNLPILVGGAHRRGRLDRHLLEIQLFSLKLYHYPRRRALSGADEDPKLRGHRGVIEHFANRVHKGP